MKQRGHNELSRSRYASSEWIFVGQRNDFGSGLFQAFIPRRILRVSIDALKDFIASVEEEIHARSSCDNPDCCDLAASTQRLIQIVLVMQTALEVYAMTNKTFPEYGDVAREVLLKAEEICK